MIHKPVFLVRSNFHRAGTNCSKFHVANARPVSSVTSETALLMDICRCAIHYCSTAGCLPLTLQWQQLSLSKVAKCRISTNKTLAAARPLKAVQQPAITYCFKSITRGWTRDMTLMWENKRRRQLEGAQKMCWWSSSLHFGLSSLLNPAPPLSTKI